MFIKLLLLLNPKDPPIIERPSKSSMLIKFSVEDMMKVPSTLAIFDRFERSVISDVKLPILPICKSPRTTVTAGSNASTSA